MGFLFEDLDVYKRAVALADVVRSVSKSLPRGEWQLADQFRRAAMSVPLNIAEGSGRFHPGDKRQFYLIARGLCYECIPILELCLRAEVVDQRTVDALRRELDIVARMLTKLIQATEGRK